MIANFIKRIFVVKHPIEIIEHLLINAQPVGQGITSVIYDANLRT